MAIIAGVDLGGTAVNYTLLDFDGQFLIDGLCEHPARSVEGPEVCLQQIEDGLAIAAHTAGIPLNEIAVIGLDTPGPASATGVLSAKGSTNFVHPAWAGLDLPAALSAKLGRPVTYLNDGNAGALWGHVSIFGADTHKTSISAIVGTGLGGGVIVNGQVVKGRDGFGGELGHVLLPYRDLPGLDGATPRCNCGRIGDLESVCSLTAIRNLLLPHFLARHPGHELAILPIADAAKRVRGLAQAGDVMCRDIFRVQARALGMFFDQMVNIFDPGRADCRWRRRRDFDGLSAVGPRRDSSRHADAACRAGRHPHPSHAQRRHRWRAGRRPGRAGVCARRDVWPLTDGARRRTSMLDALIWVVVGGVLAFMMWRVRRRRPHVGSGGAGAVYDLLNDDKRKAIEVVVDGRAERQDPEHADDTLADDGDEFPGRP